MAGNGVRRLGRAWGRCPENGRMRGEGRSGKKAAGESTEGERGLKQGWGGLVWALSGHVPIQCVAFLSGISQTQKYVHTSHSPVLLGVTEWTELAQKI